MPMRYFFTGWEILGYCSNSTERSDLLELGGLAPSAPEVYRPTEGIYGRYLTINYTQAVSPNGYDIIFYNLTLVNVSESEIASIISNNSKNLSFVWDSSVVASGEYLVKVVATDENGLTSFGLSENFTLDHTPPYFTSTSFTDTISYGTDWGGINLNATDVVGFGTFTTDNTNFTINSTGFLNDVGILGVGVYPINVTINDTSNNLNSSIFTLTITQISPSISVSGTSPITYGDLTDVSGSGCPTELTCALDIANDIYGVGTSPVTFNYSTVGNENYSADSDTVEITINQAAGEVGAWVNNNRGNYNANNDTNGYRENIWLNSTLETGLGDIELWFNGSQINDGESPLGNQTDLYIGSYNVTGIYGGNENYTSDLEYWLITISESTETTTTTANTCRYKKLGYYNTNLPWYKEVNCI